MQTLDGVRVSIFESEPLSQRVLLALGPARCFVIATIVYVLVPWAWSDTLWTRGDVKGLSSPENHYIYVLPVLFAAVAYYVRESSFLIQKLVARGVLTAAGSGRTAADSESGPDVLELLRRIVSDVSSSPLSRFARPIPWIVGIVVPVMFLFNGAQPADRPEFIKMLVGREPHTPGWLFAADGIRPIAFYFSFVFHGVGLAVLTTWAFSHLRAARVLARIFDGSSGLSVNLRILHPDDCMGLGPVSEVVRDCAVVLVPISLTVFLWSAGLVLAEPGFDWLTTPGFLVAWGFYMVFAPLLFFAPLVSARGRMWTLKEQTLGALGRQVTEAEDLDAVVKLSENYQRAQRASVWPFTTATLSGFFASLGAPLLIAAISELLRKIVGN